MNYNNVSFVTSCGVSDQIPPCDKAEVCFSGRSNVGKSSLINKLINRKSMARVSTKPGKTATINFFNLDEKINLCDLPGYGYAKVSKSERARWGELMEHYFGSNREIDLCFQLVDMRHPPSADDVNMLKFLCDAEIPFVIVLTKSDKLNKTERKNRLEKLTDELNFFEELPEIIPFSAVNGEGIDRIHEILEEIAD